VYIRATAPRSIGGVLDDGLRLWRDSLSKTWPLAFIAQLVAALPVLFIQASAPPIAPAGKSFLAAAAAANAQFAAGLLKSPILLLAYLAALVVSIACYAGIILRLAGVAKDDVPSLGAAVAGGFRLVPRVLGQFLLFVLVILLAMAAKTLATPLLVVFLLLLGVFLLGRIFLAFISLVADDAGPIESVTASWRLTRGYWWRCAAILVVLIFIAVVFSLVVGFAISLIAVSMGGAGMAAQALTQLVAVLANALLGSLYPAVLMAIYYDLKLRKEGADLLGRVKSLAPQ
jgi:hypothetical protein